MKDGLWVLTTLGDDRKSRQGLLDFGPWFRLVVTDPLGSL
jgi:hypothetical protein